MSLSPSARKLWASLRNPNCTACPLHATAQTVCLMGDGPVPCDIMIVGEAPGFREDEVEKPFAGKSGKLLEQTLEAHGLSRSKCFLTNVNKCRPPENRTPNKTEQKACRHYLDDEIAWVKPKFILLVGNTALSVIKKSGIMSKRGETFSLGDAAVMATVHPAAVLRNPRFASAFDTDIATFARLVRGEKAAVPPPKTFLVKDKKALVACTKSIMMAEAVAYDLENTGFEENAPDAEIVTIGISPKPGIAFVVPVHHPDHVWKAPQRVLQAVGNALAYTKAKRIAHNAKYDDRWLQHFGCNVFADFDTMIAAHVLDENRFKSLKYLAQLLLGVDPWADVDWTKGGAKATPLTKLARYNAKDADYTLRLYYEFKRALTKPGNERILRLFAKLLMPASRTLTTVEATGMWVDRQRLLERIIEVDRKLGRINRKLLKLTGTEANWNSPQQLAEILFGQLKLPIYDLTGKGAPSTKESVLLRLQDEHPVPKLILEWRQWAKNKSTYFSNWAEKMDDRQRIHPNYKITGTVTGRLASGKEDKKDTRIGVQQVPRDPFIRSCIGAPKNWRFVEADFSQVELRIAAHYSQDPTMTRIFQMDGDPHMTMAMAMTGKTAEHITSEERKKAKAVNFGFLYGMGASKFVDYARDSYGVNVSEAEAKMVRKRFFEQYQTLLPWHERQRRLVNQYQRVQSIIGRVRHLPDVLSEDKEVRAEAERQAINSPVQGLGSDFCLLSMNLLHEMMPPSEARVVGTVHDSILFEIRKDRVKHWAKVIHTTMENLPLKKMFGAQLSIPIKVDVKSGRHWAEGKVI